MSETGRIALHVDDDSVFLSEHLPWTIRDARHAIVASGTTREGVRDPLPPGLYSVEVMTPRGVEQTELVQVTADETTRLLVTEDGVSAGDAPPAPARRRMRRGPFMYAADPAPAAPAEAPPDAAADAAPAPAPPPEAPGEAAPAEGAPTDATLIATSGCTLASQDEDGWVFLPESPLTDVPFAAFDLDGIRYEVSLPLNPNGNEPRVRRCRVRVDRGSMIPRLEVTVGDRRRVFRLLTGMLRTNGVAGGAELLDAAAGLLLTKYSDPVAAALGGLTLHRFGRLQEKQAWVENLSRDFPWLPDGRILCAALLRGDEDDADRDRGLDLLLSATQGRPFYTDGLSLGLELLRRWPGGARLDERKDRLERLSRYSATADWESIALTTAVEA